MSDFHPMRALVRRILEHPDAHQWSLQGFGMLRTYLDAAKQWRLNIWHSKFAVPGVSVIHDHPWDFTSWVVFGSFTNQRYRQIIPAPLQFYSAVNLDMVKRAKIFEWMTIKTGEGGSPTSEREFIALAPQDPERLWSMSTYEQRASEIHASYYEDGTVTLNDRRRLPDGEHARVFWPAGTTWVDAEPREATPDEVYEMTSFALSKFGG